MEENVRIILVVGVLVALIFLGATVVLCAGLADIVLWAGCRALLDLVASAVHAVATAIRP